MNLRSINPQEVELFSPGGRPAPYSNGVLALGASNLLFISGQVAFDDNGALVSAEIDAQAEQALRNLIRILSEAGSSPRHLIKLTAFLTDRAYVEPCIAARERNLTAGCRPASTTVICELVRPEMLIEIEAIAVVPGETVVGSE
jgi:enamine deaminase RidA (YjgF/YER057c/UK114 family)